MKVADIEFGQGKPLMIIAGPCMMESFDTMLNTATVLKDLSRQLGFSLVFKASFDKANRTSFNSFRGPGLEKGMQMMSEIKAKLGLPVLTDVHEVNQCKPCAEVVDILQIPAFLCRQTDLVVEAARTGKAVNIKKGQFVSPNDIVHSVKKVVESGNDKVFVTERGTTFGYNNLVVDMRSIPIIQEQGYPVIFDATHSVQLPSGAGGVSSGQRQFIPALTKAALAAGCSGLFMEVHPNPDKALSDGATQIPLNYAKEFIGQCLKVYELAQSLPEIKLPGVGECSELALTK